MQPKESWVARYNGFIRQSPGNYAILINDPNYMDNNPEQNEDAYYNEEDGDQMDDAVEDEDL